MEWTRIGINPEQFSLKSPSLPFLIQKFLSQNPQWWKQIDIILICIEDFVHQRPQLAGCLVLGQPSPCWIHLGSIAPLGWLTCILSARICHRCWWIGTPSSFISPCYNWLWAEGLPGTYENLEKYSTWNSLFASFPINLWLFSGFSNIFHS